MDKGKKALEVKVEKKGGSAEKKRRIDPSEAVMNQNVNANKKLKLSFDKREVKESDGNMVVAEDTKEATEKVSDDDSDTIIIEVRGKRVFIVSDDEDDVADTSKIEKPKPPSSGSDGGSNSKEAGYLGSEEEDDIASWFNW